MGELPKRTAEDAAYTLIKAGLSALPIIGGPIATLIEVVIAPPLNKRRVVWLLSLAERIKLLEKKVEGFKIENLADNEQFITSVIRATASAARTHQGEKMEALRNAVINVALENEPDEDLQQIFLNYIDDLMPSHLRILSFFSSDLGEWFEQSKIRKPDLNTRVRFAAHEIAFAELQKLGVLEQLIVDLRNRGLLEPKMASTEYGRLAYAPTGIGAKFLRFISVPQL